MCINAELFLLCIFLIKLKKLRDTKGNIHAKIGTIKGKNGMDLTEAEDMKKRWQEYIEELYKKDLHDPDNHDDDHPPRARHPAK